MSRSDSLDGKVKGIAWEIEGHWRMAMELQWTLAKRQVLELSDASLSEYSVLTMCHFILQTNVF